MIPTTGFWTKVAVSGIDDCWIWNGGKTSDGYGLFYVKGGNRVYAHRSSWEQTNGSLPEGKSVLHKCDNPPCVNPRHLFLGTQAENMQDMWKKGRGVLTRVPHEGESNPCAKLTDESVRAIRQQLSDGVKGVVLARFYGVVPATISEIKNGKKWKCVV